MLGRMLPADVCALLRAQHGCASRPQLIGLGHTEGTIEGWVQHGRLEIVTLERRRLRGVYRVPGGAVFPEHVAMAAALRCRPKAAVTGPFVLGWFGIEGFSLGDPFRVIVPPDRRLAPVPFPVLHDDVDRHAAGLGPVPGVNATRAIVDAALEVHGKRLRVAIDSAVFLGRTSVRRLRACAEHAAHEGAAAVLALLDDGVFDVESEGERAMRPIIEAAGIQVRWQEWVSPRRRVDGRLVDAPIVLEYLGERAHGAGRRPDDHARDRELRDLGYLPLYVTRHDLREPPVLVARVLAAREAILAVRGAAAPRP